METDDIRFFKCGTCGNIITKLKDSSVGVVCCGERMTELIPNTTDGAMEKHVPVVENMGCHIKVTVGSEPHPMTDSHYIQWIVIKTSKGMQVKYLKPTDPPVANFVLADDEKFEAVYEYCNLHGLWKS